MGCGCVMTPIQDLEYKRQWGSNVIDLLKGMTHGDDFTYTMRLSVPKAKRIQIRKKLEATKKEGFEDIDGLLNFLDENDWDVSFLVDCY